MNFFKRLRDHKVLRYVTFSLMLTVALLAAAIVASVTVDLGPVLDFAPFGIAEGLPSEASDTDQRTGFVLLGITVAQPESRSQAIISGGDVPVANYGIGAVVSDGVMVTGVFADHVVISVNGQDQVLAFAPGNAGAQVALDAVDLSSLAAPGPKGETQLGRYRADLLQDAPGLLHRLGLQPTATGYLVTDAAADQILQAGLLPGDLISAVNGQPLGGISQEVTQIVARLDEVAAAGHANLSIVRDGKTRLMTFPLQ